MTPHIHYSAALAKSHSKELTISAADGMERSLHDSLGLWATDHARRYAELDVLEFDSGAYPEQRLESCKTRTSASLDLIPAESLTSVLREAYDRTTGPGGAGVLSAFLEPAGGAGDVQPLGEQMGSLLREGKSVALLVGHADRLDDIGAFCGAAAVALGDAALITRNGAVMNKVMTRESYSGVPIRSLFELFGNIYWVVPETENALRWHFDPAVSRYVNANAMRAILADVREGIVLTLAPGGSAMVQKKDAAGKLASLTIPSVGRGTANLISKFDSYLVAVSWEGRVLRSPLLPIPDTVHALQPERRRLQAEFVNEAMDTMVRLTERLAGVPTRYISNSSAAPASLTSPAQRRREP